MNRKLEFVLQVLIAQGAVVGTRRKLLGLEFVWWGPSQWYKWRWHGDHIDLGMLSIYGIERQWLWLPLAVLIWPLRKWYHWRYVHRRPDRRSPTVGDR